MGFFVTTSYFEGLLKKKQGKRKIQLFVLLKTTVKSVSSYVMGKLVYTDVFWGEDSKMSE